MDRRLRSVLYVPGVNDKAMRKAATLPADAVVFDLEDSVLHDRKAEARERVASFLLENRAEFQDTYVVIRVNGDDTSFWQADMSMVSKVLPDAVLLPKVAQPAVVRAARSVLSHASDSLKIWCMVENPIGILRLESIVEQGLADGMECLVLGTNDLVKDSDIDPGDNRSNLMPWLAHVVLVAKSFGVPVIDGVLNDIHDLDALKVESELAKAMGMSGKTLIHPAQIDTVNRSFSPTQDQLRWWQRIVDAFAKPENEAKGVINLDGSMVERLHLEVAQQKLRSYTGIDVD